MNVMHSILLIAVVAAVTALLRFLPFAVFGGRRKVPDFILYLGNVLPAAIIGMLIVYCLRDIRFPELSGWLPDLISAAAVVLLHLWKRNTLLSILGGTVLYMVLVQGVFV